MKLLLLGFALVFASCSAFKSAAHDAAQIAIDCTSSSVKAQIAEYGPAVEAVVINSIGPGGKVDWSPVRSATRGFTSKAGGCVIDAVVNRLINPPPPKPGAPQSAPIEVDREQLAGEWNAQRREQFAGASYRQAQP